MFLKSTFTNTCSHSHYADLFKFVSVFSKDSELVGSLVKLALVFDGVGQGFSKVREAFRHIVLDYHVHEQRRQGEWLSTLGP